MVATVDVPGFDQAMAKVKKNVYKNRIRLNEFFRDFDKLRVGDITPTQFLAGLNMAGLNKALSTDELQRLAEAYTFDKTDSLKMVNYRSFCKDVDTVFTVANLEKTPLAEVPAEPEELLDKTRYQRSSRILAEEDEARLEAMLQEIREKVLRRGILVKPFFDDAARNKNSPCLVGHVTEQQFKQVVNVDLEFKWLSDHDVQLLVDKFRHDDFYEMINYMAFSATVDPPEGAYDPYSLK